GHEFHYSEIDEPSARIRRVYRIPTSTPYLEGYLYKNTLTSYIHLHFASNPKFAQGFVESCVNRI
ncbi:MAG: cobyrinic acid a,c-diamide synthase, partial [Deltaproteobacteria bacterium]|nr:cobyrinic acid a,c-diamide synthase [Deltaproteobacteria bacterium]